MNSINRNLVVFFLSGAAVFGLLLAGWALIYQSHMLRYIEAIDFIKPMRLLSESQRAAYWGFRIGGVIMMLTGVGAAIAGVTRIIRR